MVARYLQGSSLNESPDPVPQIQIGPTEPLLHARECGVEGSRHEAAGAAPGGHHPPRPNELNLKRPSVQGDRQADFASRVQLARAAVRGAQPNAPRQEWRRWCYCTCR